MVADTGGQPSGVPGSRRTHPGVLHEQHAVPGVGESTSHFLVALPQRLPVDAREQDDIARTAHVRDPSRIEAGWDSRTLD